MECDMSSAARNPVEFIELDALQALSARAAKQPRGRINRNYHAYPDGYQRLLNAVEPGSYIQPHRHRDPPKAESFVVLTGEIAFFAFDDGGGVSHARRLGPRLPARGVDLAPGVWHCFFALAPGTVVFEGKNGPYDPATDKEFAPWAPAEGDPAATAYMAQLLTRFDGGT